MAPEISAVYKGLAQRRGFTLSLLGIPRFKKGRTDYFPRRRRGADSHGKSNRTGLEVAIKEAFASGTPILGICLGAQVVLDRSEEGDTPCLGIIAGKTVRFKLQDKSLKIPHIGWNYCQSDTTAPVTGRH